MPTVNVLLRLFLTDAGLFMLRPTVDSARCCPPKDAVTNPVARRSRGTLLIQLLFLTSHAQMDFGATLVKSRVRANSKCSADRSRTCTSNLTLVCITGVVMALVGSRVSLGKIPT